MDSVKVKCSRCKKADVPEKKNPWDPEICPACTVHKIARFLHITKKRICQSQKPSP